MLTASRRINKFPTAGTDTVRNARQMPWGVWTRLELTEPLPTEKWLGSVYCRTSYIL